MDTFKRFVEISTCLVNLINKTDLVRRLWLDNYFYGTNFSLQHQKENNQFIIGGGWNTYEGKHFGEIKWAQVKGAVPVDHRWYELTADKNDFSLFTKWTEQWNSKWLSFFDVQFRSIRYTINGFRNTPSLQVKNNYGFFNPKFGLTYSGKNWTAYASYAFAAHEPNRDDFEANNNEQPRSEKLNDLEIGIEKKNTGYGFSANIYFMKYKDQLVLTGKINDVGAYTRINIPNSYRAGLELQGRLDVTDWFNIMANATFSTNKIKNYTEYLDDYDNGGQQSIKYKKTDIAFSPNIIAGGNINFQPVKNLELSLIGKYAARQFLDNTAQKSRSLDPFYTQDIRLSYLLENKFFKTTHLILQMNNVFNKKYEPNGYTYSYIYNQQVTTENFYFPMAGLNFFATINIKF